MRSAGERALRDTARRLLRDERGEGLSDHALVLGILALGTLVVLVALGDRVRHLLVGAGPPPAPPG
jgi:Flp pilus assembly pilin Flp